MPKDIPSIYLLHGDDGLAISEFIAILREKLGDPSSSQMNVQRFDGETLDMGKLHQACLTVPFLSTRRLVILENAQAAMRNAEQAKALFDLMPRVPQSTALVLVKDKEPKKGKSALLQWAHENPSISYIRDCATPQGHEFASWLMKHCAGMGGAIEPQAAQLLSELVGSDSRLANNELQKLLDYVNRERPIEVSDVEQITPFHGQTSIFDMVDAMGLRHGSQAFKHLHRLLEDHPPLYAFSMIVRQFRLLIQAREALDGNINPRSVLDVPGFVADKVSLQARNFKLSDLERIYHKLLEIDLESKSGGPDLEVALDSLLATLTG